jgi:hypothetical protein
LIPFILNEKPRKAIDDPGHDTPDPTGQFLERHGLK